jgi:hypothetical protein
MEKTGCAIHYGTMPPPFSVRAAPLSRRDQDRIHATLCTCSAGRSEKIIGARFV